MSVYKVLMLTWYLYTVSCKFLSLSSSCLKLFVTAIVHMSVCPPFGSFSLLSSSTSPISPLLWGLKKIWNSSVGFPIKTILWVIERDSVNTLIVLSGIDIKCLQGYRKLNSLGLNQFWSPEGPRRRRRLDSFFDWTALAGRMRHQRGPSRLPCGCSRHVYDTHGCHHRPMDVHMVSPPPWSTALTPSYMLTIIRS